MERRLLSTVLLFSLAEVIEGMIEKLKKATCAGCEIDHPSQTRHTCIMRDDQEHLNMHFDRVYDSFKLLDVLKVYKERSDRLNVSNEVIWQFFFLNVIVTEKLRTKEMKNKVYQLLQKKRNLEERFTA